MNEQEAKGRIEAISFTNKAIKLDDGRWYKASNKTEEYVMKMQKGDIVNLKYTVSESGKFKDNIISFISKGKEPAKDMETVKSYQEQQKQKSDDITILALMKIGATLFQVLHEKKTYDELMKGVIAEYRRLQQDFRENGK